MSDPGAVADVVGGTGDAGGIGVVDSLLARGRAATQSRAAGEEQPAPAKLGSRRHQVLGPAPGTYVLQPA